MAPERVPYPTYTRLYSTTQAGEPPKMWFSAARAPASPGFQLFQGSLCSSEGLSRPQVPQPL